MDLALRVVVVVVVGCKLWYISIARKNTDGVGWLVGWMDVDLDCQKR